MLEPTIPSSFFAKVVALGSTDAKIRWYYCVMVNLAALNMPMLVPKVYEHMASHVMTNLNHEQQFAAARKLREAFIKGAGIQGAAKVSRFPREIPCDAH